MFWNCSAWSCQSDLSTQINGRQIKLFPYPKDKSLQDHWKNVCKKVSHVKDNNFFRLCELHFEKRYITKDLILKPNAIPTIFDHPNRKRVYQNIYSDRCKSSSPQIKKSKRKPNSSTEIVQNSSLHNEENKSKSQESSTKTSSNVNNSVKVPVKSENTTVRYRLVIDIDKIRPVSVKKNGKSTCKNQKSVVKHCSDASQKRKRKEDDEEKEKIVIDKIEIEDEENSRYFDQYTETENSQNESSNDSIQERETVDKKLRFLDQNLKNELYQDTLQSLDNSRDDCTAEYLRFSDKNETTKEKCDSHQEEEKEEEYLIFSDQNETSNINQDKLQTSYEEKGEEEYPLFSKQNVDTLQTINDSHQEKMEDVNNDDDEEEEEEMEEEYLIFSDQSEPNEDILQPSNDYSQTPSIKSNQLSTKSDNKLCKNGCALERITQDENISYRCMNCNNIYNVINKSDQEISNDIYCLDKEMQITNSTSKIILSESTTSVKILSEHLIFTTTGNIHPCGGNCELTRTIYNDDKAYKCEKCGNIYKSSVDKVIQLSYSDDEEVTNISDFFKTDDGDNSEDVSSTFLDDDSASDITNKEGEDSPKASPNQSKKLNVNNGENVTNITEPLTRCKDGCQLEKIQLNGGTSMKCILCHQRYELKDKNKLETNLLKTSDEMLKKYKNKLTIENKTNTAKEKMRRAKDLLKVLQAKSRNVNDMLKIIRKSKIAGNLLKTRNETLKKNNQIWCHKSKKENHLLKTPNKSTETRSLLKTSIKKTPNDEIKLEKNVETKVSEKKINNQTKMSKNIRQEEEIIDLEEDNLENFTCNICDLPFGTKDLLKEHIFDMHGIKPEELLNSFEIPDCKSILIENETRQMDTSPERLENSISSKSETKFSCDNCEMKFSTLEEINLHKKIHLESIKKLKCNICQHVFIDNNLFRVHLREHIKDSYQCQQCSKAFINEASLQIHMQTHQIYFIIQH